jgi:VWFA-related protein
LHNQRIVEMLVRGILRVVKEILSVTRASRENWRATLVFAFDRPISSPALSPCKRACLSLFTVVLWTCLTASFPTPTVLAQSPPREDQRIKDFGSTLKRLKWDPKKRAAVESRRKEEKGKGQAPEDVIRVETWLVLCDVLVFDKVGQPVRGLTQDDFVVTEDGRAQQVGTFSAGVNSTMPRSIILVLDYSLNQSGFVETSVEAAKALVDGLSSRDRMAIVTDEVKLLVDFTQDKKKLKETLESLRDRAAFDKLTPSFRSVDRDSWLLRGAHFSALLATLNEASENKDQRLVIIFQANGNEASLLQNSILPHPPLPPDDLPSGKRKEAREIYRETKQHEERISGLREFSLDDVYRAAEKSRATIYTIIPGYRLIGLSLDEQINRAKIWTLRYRLGWAEATSRDDYGGRRRRQITPDWMWSWVAECLLKEQSALAVLARITGGWTDFLEEPSQATDVYARILSDMNSRYVIGYYPANKERDGTRRKIGIEVRGHPEYVVLGRNSYLAPTGE